MTYCKCIVIYSWFIQLKRLKQILINVKTSRKCMKTRWHDDALFPLSCCASCVPFIQMATYLLFFTIQLINYVNVNETHRAVRINGMKSTIRSLGLFCVCMCFCWECGKREVKWYLTYREKYWETNRRWTKIKGFNNSNFPRIKWNL